MRQYEMFGFIKNSFFYRISVLIDFKKLKFVELYFNE